MPLILALLASSLLHVAAVISPGWVLPDVLEPDLPSSIDAVLVKAPVHPESAPVAKPTPKPPLRKPASPAAAPAVAAVATPSEAPAVAAAAPQVEEPVAVTGPRRGVPGTQSEPAPATAETAAPVPANTSLPGKGRMRYVITRGEGGFIIGQSVHSWDHDGFTYRLKSMTETIGIAAVFKPAQVLQSSQGEITDTGLRPREFRHERAAGIDTASFDWVRRVVTYSGRQDILSDGTQDLLSMYYQVVLLAPRSGAIEMPIATGRKLGNYRFEVLGEETLSFPTGERRAVRIKTRSGNDTIEMWLSVGEGDQSRGMPLKIRITDRKGEIYDQIADNLPATETK
jgi:hypothetical protein